ncbi:MAG: hypothetical protein RSF00_09680, partial [Oscillospiraceae bacterium]
TRKQQQALLQYNIRNNMGFAPNLKEIKASTKGVKLSAAQYFNSQENTAIIVKSPYKQSEFFVIEMKKQTGIDSEMLRADGLLTYRINANAMGNGNGPPDFLYVWRPNDSSPTSSLGEHYFPFINPNTDISQPLRHKTVGKAYGAEKAGFDADTLFFSDGSNSGIVVDNLVMSPDGQTMTFDVTVPTLGGDGTEASPYLISKAEDFKLLAEQPTAYFKLANDIDLNGVPFSMINTGNGFLGQLDGDNHTIKNMTINAASGDAALMSSLGIGTNNVRGRVINLVFENPVINAANGNAAVVASGSQGIIKNVHIKGGSVTATSLAGGFTANCGDTSELIECSTTASIKGAAEAGGLSGRIHSGLVSMCFIGGSVGGAAPAQGAVTGKYYTSNGNSINVKNVYWNDAVGQIVAGTTDGNAKFANTVG